MNSKINRIMAAGLLFCLLCVFASFWFGRSAGENIAFLFQYRRSLSKINSLETSLSRMPSGVSADSVRAEIEKSKYDSTKLSADISESMSKYGMVVMDVSVRQTSGKEVTVSIRGVVPADRLDGFILGISSMDKLFFVKKLDIAPRNSSAQIISRLDQLRQNPKQFQAVKSEIKESDLSTFNVEMEVLVVTS